MNIERFFQGVQDRAAQLPDHEQGAIADRLRLAREFIGAQEPLTYFLGWKTPLERYQPIYPHISDPDAKPGTED
jgi:hypothetical protein